MGTEASAGRGLVVVGRGYWNIKGLGYVVVFFGLNYICFMRLCGYHSRPRVVSLWYHSRKEDFVGKTTVCRTYRYPSGELRGKVLAAVKKRGFRSEQAFLIAPVSTSFGRAITRKRRPSLRPASRPPSQIWRRRYSHSSLWPIPSLL